MNISLSFLDATQSQTFVFNSVFQTEIYEVFFDREYGVREVLGVALLLLLLLLLFLSITNFCVKNVKNGNIPSKTEIFRQKRNNHV